MARKNSQNRKSRWAKFASLWSASKKPNWQKRLRVRPQIEILEERKVPAVFVVNTAADNTIEDDDVTLREAILAANGASVSIAPLRNVAGQQAQHDSSFLQFT